MYLMGISCLLQVFVTGIPTHFPLPWFQQIVNKKNAKYKFWKRGNDVDFSCDCQKMMSRTALHWFMEYEFFIISLLYIIMWRHLQTTSNIHSSGLGYSLQNNTFQDTNLPTNPFLQKFTFSSEIKFMLLSNDHLLIRPNSKSILSWNVNIFVKEKTQRA